MTTIFIISLATVLAPIAINGAIAYFRPGAPAQEVKAKKVELAPANPWEYVGSKETDYTAPSSWEHVDDVPARDTNVEADNELPTVDVTPVTSTTLAQDATFTTTVDNVIGGTDFVSGSVVTLAHVDVDGVEFVNVPPVVPDVPVEVPPVAPDVPLKVEPPTDTPDVPVEVPPVNPEVPLTDESVTVYWEEWEHYEKSVTITDFSWCFDSTYIKDGFVESTYMSAYEYRADTVADYYRNSVGVEYFAESTAVSECFFEEYSVTVGDLDGYGFNGDLDSYTAISASVSVHAETVSETISAGSLVITK